MRIGMQARRVSIVALVVALATVVLTGTAGAANPWARVAAPSPGGVSNQLISVSCVTETSCVAVGWYISGRVVRPLVIRTTNGTTWIRSTAPSVGVDTELFDVSCTSASACTAVGAYRSGGTDQDPAYSTYVARTTNGSSWSRVQSPNPFGFSSVLWGIDCVTAAHCRAVGSAEGNSIVLRTSDGATWFRQPTPNRGQGGNTLISIDCVSNVNCTAVGSYYNQPSNTEKARTLALHTTDGRTWVVATTPNPSPKTSDTELVDVSCAGPSVCTAVGTLSPAPGGVERALIMRTGNGASWTRQATPVASGEVVLQGLSCSSTTQCTAVGFQWNADQTLFTGNLLRTTNGTSWSSPSPASERLGRGLVGVGCATPVKCVGVGSFNTSGNPSDQFKTLVMKET